MAKKKTPPKAKKKTARTPVRKRVPELTPAEMIESLIDDFSKRPLIEYENALHEMVDRAQIALGALEEDEPDDPHFDEGDELDDDVEE